MVKCVSCLDDFQAADLKTMICGCIRCAPCREALEHRCPTCSDVDSIGPDVNDASPEEVRKKLYQMQAEIVGKLERAERIREGLELDLNTELEKLQYWTEKYRTFIISSFDAGLTQVYSYEKLLESTAETMDTHLNLQSAPEGEAAFLQRLSEIKIERIPRVKTWKFNHYQNSTEAWAKTYSKKQVREPDVHYLVTYYDRIYYWTEKRRTKQLMADDVLVFEYPKSARNPDYHSSTPECDYFLWKDQIYLVSDLEWTGPFPKDSVPAKACLLAKGFVRKDVDAISFVTRLSSVSFTKDAITFTELNY